MTSGQEILGHRILSFTRQTNTLSVFLAEHILLGRKAAIIEINKQEKDKNNANFDKNLDKVVSAQARLQHPNISLLYQYQPANADNNTENNAIIIREWVEGQTLAQVLQSTNNVPMSQERAKNIFLQLLDALAYAHHKGIIHANLSAENIIIDKNDKVKITDFGLSEAQTSAYQSPEVIKKDVLDKRSDIYSLGAIFFHLLTGKTPATDALDIKKINSKIDKKIAQIILKCTLSDSYKRYQTCEEIRNEFFRTENTSKTNYKSTIIMLGVGAATVGGAVWVGKNMLNQQEKAINSVPLVIKPKEKIDSSAYYQKILDEQNKNNKDNKEKQEKAKKDSLKKLDPEEIRKDSLEKVEKFEKEAREKRIKLRKENLMKNLLIDGQFVSNTAGEYKVKVEIFNRNTDAEFTDLKVVVSYFNGAGDVIEKEEKFIEKIGKNAGAEIEITKKVNATRFSCKLLDVKVIDELPTEVPKEMLKDK